MAKSAEAAFEEVTSKIRSEYESRTPRSRAVTAQAQEFMPGGDTRRSIFFFPYPIWIDHADGCHVYDEDVFRLVQLHR